jgi:hypothetical protein
VVKNRLNSFGLSGVTWDKVRAAAAGLGYAEVTRACMEAAKAAVLGGQDAITTENLLSMLRERTAILGRDTSS